MFHVPGFIDGHIVYKSVSSVFTQVFSLVMWLLTYDRTTNPKKVGQCRYCWVCQTDKKKKDSL